jgi:WD40 repeat protein
VRVWDVRSGKLLREYRGHSGTIRDVKFHPGQSELVASTGDDGSVKFWGLDDEQDVLTFTDHSESVYTARFVANGTWAASAGADGKVLIWDTLTRKVVRTLAGHKQAIGWLSVSPDGMLLATVSRDQTVRVWEVATGVCLATIEDQHPLICVEFSPDGKLLAFAGEGGDISLWDVARRAPVKTLPGHKEAVTRLTFNPDGKQLASCGREGQVLVWEVATGRLTGHPKLASGTGSALFCVAYSPDGRYLAAGGADSRVQLWNARTGQLVHTLRGHTQPIHAVAFSQDSKRLVSTGLDCARIWDTNLGRELLALEQSSGGGWSVDFSRDGELLIAVSGKRVVVVGAPKVLP